MFAGGSAGGNVLSAGAGQVTLFGGGAGDVLTIANGASNIVVGGSGAETLDGSAATGSSYIYAGTGPDVLLAGAGTTVLIGGIGADTLQGGTGTTLFAFFDGRGGGSEVVEGWDATHDHITLQGFGAGAMAGVAGLGASGSDSVLTLTYGTRVTFLDTATLATSSFI